MDSHSSHDPETTYQHFKDVIAKYSKELEIRPHLGFATKAIHAAQEPEKIHGSVAVPIHLSTTFAQKAPGELYSNFDYSRYVLFFNIYLHNFISLFSIYPLKDVVIRPEKYLKDASLN